MAASDQRSRLAERAQQLRALHHGSEPLVLPNAWDAASARAVVAAGFPVVATSSSAVATSLGWQDGQQMPADEMFAAVARIARAVEAPLTADIEAGYGLDATTLVRKLIEAGAVGCNLEDTDHGSQVKGLRDPTEQAQWLREVKQAAAAASVDIVVNARVDVFIRNRTETEDDIAEAVRRAALYLEAGADCIYPILVREERTIASLVQQIPAPVNMYAMADAPPLHRLKELGVRRISFAGRMQRLAMTELQSRLEQIARGEDPR